MGECGCFECWFVPQMLFTRIFDDLWNDKLTFYAPLQVPQHPHSQFEVWRWFRSHFVSKPRRWLIWKSGLAATNILRIAVTKSRLCCLSFITVFQFIFWMNRTYSQTGFQVRYNICRGEMNHFLSSFAQMLRFWQLNLWPMSLAHSPLVDSFASFFCHLDFIFYWIRGYREADKLF